MLGPSEPAVGWDFIDSLTVGRRISEQLELCLQGPVEQSKHVARHSPWRVLLACEHSLNINHSTVEPHPVDQQT